MNGFNAIQRYGKELAHDGDEIIIKVDLRKNNSSLSIW